ncbi:glycosyltransferase [Sphaerimonospora sp. CA-214678]|uniref:glycosyltransferase n=1 Tax=Sphaerimonospora sp. CA-214678 TaxID=3240029 RepID=UPI003D8D715C
MTRAATQATIRAAARITTRITTRAAARGGTWGGTRGGTRTVRTWGACLGFESCPELLDRLTEVFPGPWTRLAEIGVVAGSAVAGPYDSVVIAVRSPADVRRAVPMRDLLPRAPRVRIAVAEVPPWAVQPLPTAGDGTAWRHLVDLRIRRRSRGWQIDARFAEPVAAGEVLAHVAHGLFGARRHLTQPVVGLAGADAARWRPGDLNATPSPPGGRVPERRDAPGCDLLLRVAEDGATPWHAVPGDGGPWEAVPWNPGQRRDSVPLVTRRPIGSRHPDPHPDLLPPVDEVVINPIGFRPDPSMPLAALAEHGPGLAVTCGPDVLVRLPPDGGLTDADVARLRDVRGVVVPALEGRPLIAAGIVAALAAAGVPVVAEDDPARDAALGPELATALVAVEPDRLDSDLHREEISITLRRRALRVHGAAARWSGIASAAGLPVPPEPSVSILLCTRRPEMLPFALEQLRRQRGVRAELIVGLHGDRLESAAARETKIDGGPFPVTVVTAPSARPFGEVLNRMAAVASGSFLAKVDDDDWYGPDHLADLLLAQLYSGADLVGSAAEFVYLEPIDVTIRRPIGTERFVPQVAGGTMLIARAAFEAVGGFRPLPRTVDGQLLEAVQAAGGRIYRTHGFNYVLRRRAARGHTWQQPLPSFLGSYREQWRGLVFNELMVRR